MDYSHNLPPKHYKSSRDAVPLGKVVAEVFDVPNRTIKYDAIAEKKRNLDVVEHMAIITHQLLEEKFEWQKAGRESDPIVIDVLRQQKLGLIAEREQLRQELYGDTADDPRP